jgi:hypothetical protein
MTGTEFSPFLIRTPPPKKKRSSGTNIGQAIGMNFPIQLHQFTISCVCVRTRLCVCVCVGGYFVLYPRRQCTDCNILCNKELCVGGRCFCYQSINSSALTKIVIFAARHTWFCTGVDKTHVHIESEQIK